jgi:hypothetical protein
MKARREMLRLPLDVPAARLSGTAPDQFEQTIARADIPAAVRLENNGRARPADPGIDDAEKDGSRRKPYGISRQQIGRCLRVADRRVGEEVNNACARYHLMQHRLHLARIRPVQPKVREQHNHITSMPPEWLSLRRETCLQGGWPTYHTSCYGVNCAAASDTFLRVWSE